MSETTKTCPTCLKHFDAEEGVCPEDGSMLVYKVPEEEDLVGRVVDGRYKVTGLIAEGGMGRVYRATQLSMDRTVALKVLKRSLSSDVNALRRFQNEARASSSLKNPHTVMVLDFGQEPSGLLYLAMEFVEGSSLAACIREEGAFAAKRAVTLACQILESLAEAHEQQIIHRDIKPANVLVSRTATGQEWIKVTDFGIAKIVAEDGRNDLTQTGMLVGTPQYISPEQVLGKRLDLRSDLYAVAIVLYEMLTGRPPFHEEDSTPAQVLMRHLEESPRNVALVRPDTDASGHVLQVLNWGLMKEPDQRPQSAQEFIDALRGAISGEAPVVSGGEVDSADLPTMTMPHLNIPTDQLSREDVTSTEHDLTASAVKEPAPQPPTKTTVAVEMPKRSYWKWALFLFVLAAIGVGIGVAINPVEKPGEEKKSVGESGQENGVAVSEGGEGGASSPVVDSGPDVVGSSRDKDASVVEQSADVVGDKEDIPPPAANDVEAVVSKDTVSEDVTKPPKGVSTPLRIVSDPRSARVYVDGVYRGKTPFVLTLEGDKERKITFRKKGYNTRSKKVSASSTSPLRVKLTKAEEAFHFVD